MKEQKQAENIIFFMKISFSSLFIIYGLVMMLQKIGISDTIISFLDKCLVASLILCGICVLFIILGIITLLRRNKKDGSSNDH